MVITYLSAKGSEGKEEINENLELRGGGFKKKQRRRETSALSICHTPKDRSLLKHAIIYHRTSLPAAL